MTCVILHNFRNTNLQSSLEKSVLCIFQIEASLNQHSKPGKLIQITLWLITSILERLILFRVIYRKQIQRFCRQRQLLSTLSLIINIKKMKDRKKHKFKTLLQAFTRNFRWIYLNCIIYRTSIDHSQIN